MSAGGTTDSPLGLLDPDAHRAEETYADLSSRLIQFFRGRNGAAVANDLAQETLRRGLARLAAGADIYAKDPASFFFGIAVNVKREGYRAAARHAAAPLEGVPEPGTVDFRNVETSIYLNECLSLLTPDEQEVLVRYYREDPKELAQTLRMTDQALRVKVHRTKRKLRLLILRATTPARPGATP